MPWSGETSPFGFTNGKPWLPLQNDWKEFTVEHELADLNSSLNLYKRALELRKEYFLGSGELTWTRTNGLLSFKRGKVEVLINISDQEIPISGKVILASQTVADVLPPATAIWLLS